MAKFQQRVPEGNHALLPFIGPTGSRPSKKGESTRYYTVSPHV